MLKNKIITLSALFVLFLNNTQKLSCASFNGTRIPPKGMAEVGYEYSAVSRRALDRSFGNLKSQTHFYTVSLGIFNWLALDGKIGFGDITQKGGIHLPKIEYNSGFAGGYGFRAKLFHHHKTDVSIILGAQHVSIHPKDRSVDDDKFESFLDDWQLGAIVLKKFKILTPYVGMKASDSEIAYKINKHDKKRRYSENHIGLIFGSDFFLYKDKVRVNVEARFFDETALSIAAAYSF